MAWSFPWCICWLILSAHQVLHLWHFSIPSMCSDHLKKHKANGKERSIVSQGWQKTHAAVSGQRDGFRNFNKNAQCNFSTLDIHRSFSPLCNDRKSLLEAMSGGGRIGLDAPYQTRQCGESYSSYNQSDLRSRFLWTKKNHCLARSHYISDWKGTSVGLAGCPSLHIEMIESADMCVRHAMVLHF